jgi:hypothetical protein
MSSSVSPIAMLALTMPRRRVCVSDDYFTVSRVWPTGRSATRRTRRLATGRRGDHPWASQPVGLGKRPLRRSGRLRDAVGQGCSG